MCMPPPPRSAAPADPCNDWQPATARHGPTARPTLSCRTTSNRTGSPHAVKPSVRDHTSEYAKAQRPPRKFLVQFFLPLESPGRYSKKKAKKRTGFSKRPGDASGEGNSERSNKTILAACTK